MCNIKQVVLFYGSSFSPVDLPIPRNEAHEWALLHEESPKNNPSFCHEDLITLFNHTATWSRHSHFPLTLLNLQRLDDLTGRQEIASAVLEINCYFAYRPQVLPLNREEEPTASRQRSRTRCLRPIILRRSLTKGRLRRGAAEIHQDRFVRQVSQQKTTSPSVSSFSAKNKFNVK